MKEAFLAVLMFIALLISSFISFAAGVYLSDLNGGCQCSQEQKIQPVFPRPGNTGKVGKLE